MSFSENLQTLRKSKNISQEQLAERLDVSRQAVSKWESGGGYPEMEKLIQLCELFSCSMDELMMGKISVDMPNDRKAYDDHYNRFSKGIALGVGLILFGLSLTVFLSSFERVSFLGDISAAALLLFVAAAVALFIINGIEHENFRRLHPTMPEIYSEDEINSFNGGVFPKAIALGVGLIFIAVVQVILLSLLPVNLPGVSDPEVLGAVFMLILVGIAIMIFIYYGIQHDKYDIKKYNNESSFTEKAIEQKRRDDLAGIICGIIMITATGIFLIGGALFECWHPGWIVFPIGGLICGIVNLVLGSDTMAERRQREERFIRTAARKAGLASALSGIIMLSATALYLILGFVFMLWHPGWIVFPIGGLLCGIVSLLVAISERK